MLKRLLFLSLLPIAVWAAKVPYSVYFLGLDDKEALKTIKAVSDLTTLRSRPPTSLNALRYRADSVITYNYTLSLPLILTQWKQKPYHFPINCTYD